MTTSLNRAPGVVQQYSGKKADPAPAPITRPLVFVSVGTDHHPFNRLVQWVDAWSAGRPDVEVVVQHGEATSPVHAEAVPYLSHSELFGFISRAGVIVCHGGPATIAEAWRAGMIPIVAPRGHRLGEHVDNHQQAFAAMLAARDQVIQVTTQAELVEALDHALADPQWLRRESQPGADVDASIRNFAAVVDAIAGQGGRRAQAGRRRAFRRLPK
jgi:UDP-N-acetylglucosamine transferase subunit ALG13